MAIVAGAVASSIALVGFGLDSTVEVLSASVIVWQMTRDVPEDREAQALRLIAVSFFALAGYVTVQAVVRPRQPQRAGGTSTVGIVLAAVSLVVMPVLAGLKRRNGRRLGSNSVVADSRQTMLCTYLSAVLLIGLAAQRHRRLVVGRSAGRARHRCASRSTRDARRGAASAAATMTRCAA